MAPNTQPWTIPPAPTRLSLPHTSAPDNKTVPSLSLLPSAPPALPPAAQTPTPCVQVLGAQQPHLGRVSTPALPAALLIEFQTRCPAAPCTCPLDTPLLQHVP